MSGLTLLVSDEKSHRYCQERQDCKPESTLHSDAFPLSTTVFGRQYNEIRVTVSEKSYMTGLLRLAAEASNGWFGVAGRTTTSLGLLHEGQNERVT
jgi:hypothetical protein